MAKKLPPRRLILFTGPQPWGQQACDDLILASGLTEKQVLWYPTEPGGYQFLGQDRACVIYDAYRGINPDEIGRLSGLIQAGGALILICPELCKWAKFPDPELRKLTPYPQQHPVVESHYLRRWSNILSSSSLVEIYHPDKAATIPPITPAALNTPLSKPATPDQQTAIDAVIRTVTGQRRRPAVLRADRGRGKSAALGLAAGELLRTGQLEEIIITAGGFGQTSSVYKHALALLPDATFLSDQKRLMHRNGRLRYLPPDVLLKEQPDCDLLLVDEASTQGVARLEALLQHYPRIAFAGTEHGYEGSGRGFSLKFRKLINHNSRGKREIDMQSPIRWTQGDALENLTNELLLLSVPSKNKANDIEIPLDELNLQAISQHKLASDEPRLKETFGLLIDAHYQTRPVDCRYLLDAPNSRLFAAYHHTHLVGLIWLMLEGKLEEEISREITAGRRRPQGHLVPQTLGAHMGLDEALCLSCARIQRIAVSPGLQGRGIGSWMLKQLEKNLAGDIDYLASSFGADVSLLRFWRRAGYQTVRIGDKKRVASGAHSAIVLKSQSKQGEYLLRKAADLYAPQFIAQLSENLCKLSPSLVLELAPRCGPVSELTPEQLQAAVLFAYADRPFQSTLVVLSTLARYALTGGGRIFPGEHETQALMIMRILQHRSWSECSQLLCIDKGQAKLTALLRDWVKQTLEQNHPEEQLEKLRCLYRL